MPAGDEFRKMRKASLDLSGFSLKLGLKIRLFSRAKRIILVPNELQRD